jgi:hypothetical protein
MLYKDYDRKFSMEKKILAVSLKELGAKTKGFLVKVTRNTVSFPSGLVHLVFFDWSTIALR